MEPDANGDGRITKQEMIDFYEKMLKEEWAKNCYHNFLSSYSQLTLQIFAFFLSLRLNV